MSRRFCPFNTIARGALKHDTIDMKCIEELCQLWIKTYTIEGIEVCMCAFEAMARKNAEGHITV